MATINKQMRQSLAGFESYTFTGSFDNDGDESILHTGNYRTLGVQVSGITAGDEIVVEGALAFDKANPETELGDYFQILDNTDTNPFTEDTTQALDISPFAIVKVRKTGSNGTGTDVFVSLSNNGNL